MAIQWRLTPVMVRSIAVLAALGFGALAIANRGTPLSLVSGAAALSALLLGILDGLGARIHLQKRRVLADAALLSPLLFYLLNLNEL